MPVAFSMARMFLPSLPIIRAFISSLGRGTTDTVISDAWSLDGERNYLFGFGSGLVLCLLFDVAHLDCNIPASFIKDLLGEELFGFVLGELSNFFKLLHH